MISITVEMSWRRPIDIKDDGVKDDSSRWKRRETSDKWRKDEEKPKKETGDRWRKDDFNKDDTRERGDRLDKDRGMDGRSVNVHTT